jgi:hypothetical protein
MVVLAEYRPRYLPGLLTEMDMAAAGVRGAVGRLGRDRNPRRARRRPAPRRAWLRRGLRLGAVGGPLGAVNARNGLICTNDPIPFATYAPNYAEAFLVLLIGLTGAILGLVLLSRRWP